MASKQNMYAGMKKEMKKVLDKINESIVMYSMSDDGFREIVGYDSRIAREIRDEVANMQGQLQVLLKGLDKNSPKRSDYQKVLNYCKYFLDYTNREN